MFEPDETFNCRIRVSKINHSAIYITGKLTADIGILSRVFTHGNTEQSVIE